MDSFLRKLTILLGLIVFIFFVAIIVPSKGIWHAYFLLIESWNKRVFIQCKNFIYRQIHITSATLQYSTSQRYKTPDTNINSIKDSSIYQKLSKIEHFKSAYTRRSVVIKTVPEFKFQHIVDIAWHSVFKSFNKEN